MTTSTVAPMPVRLARLVKIEHTVFALPFAYVGALLAVDGWPGWAAMGWITLAMVGARTLAMAVNRLVDAEIDARNPRTASRELPSGQLARVEVLALCVAALGVYLLAVWNLDDLVRWLWPIPVLMFMGRHDYTTPSAPTEEWLRKVDAPYKKAIWFERSAHMIPWEEPGRTVVSLARYVLPLARD